jgi:hypothetical protein
MAQSLSHSLIALLALPLAAQAVDNSYPRVSFIVGSAPAIGNSGKLMVRESMLIGLEATCPVWKGEVLVSAEWRTFRSRVREITQFSDRYLDGPDKGTTIFTQDNKTGYTPNGGRGYITAFTRDTRTGVAGVTTGGIASDMRFDSIHTAKNDLEGGSAKLGFRYYMDSSYVGKWGVHGGLTIGFLSSSEWATGSIHVLEYRRYDGQNTVSTSLADDNPQLGNNYGRLYNEYIWNDHTEKKIAPGVFAGIRLFMNDNCYLETNIATLGHASPTYVPLAYTGNPGHIDSTNGTRVVWEFIAGIRF